MNFSEASNVCNRLNLQLASKEQVEKALNHGFETCRYTTSISFSSISINSFTYYEAGDKSTIKKTCAFIVVLDG